MEEIYLFKIASPFGDCVLIGLQQPQVVVWIFKNIFLIHHGTNGEFFFSRKFSLIVFVFKYIYRYVIYQLKNFLLWSLAILMLFLQPIFFYYYMQLFIFQSYTRRDNFSTSTIILVHTLGEDLYQGEEDLKKTISVGTLDL